jgi:hypothetical protein
MLTRTRRRGAPIVDLPVRITKLRHGGGRTRRAIAAKRAAGNGSGTADANSHLRK